MRSYTLIISPLARDDLRAIYEHGINTWGAVRASAYLDRLEDGLWNLTRQPEMGIKREALLPGMRSLSVEGHVIFYRLQQVQIQIVRVLHSRQDPQRQLATYKTEE